MNRSKQEDENTTTLTKVCLFAHSKMLTPHISPAYQSKLNKIQITRSL